jgi:hypothetical protein
VGVSKRRTPLRDVPAPDERLDLVVLTVGERTAHCRILGTDAELFVRLDETRDVVPGETLTLRSRSAGRYRGEPCISGDLEGRRVDARALGLVPLALHRCGEWDPAEEYWGEDGTPIEEWAVPIVKRGSRPTFEMEQVLPGSDPDEPDDDPIIEASDLASGGRRREARQLLMQLLAVDLRCLDAHAHLGNMRFDRAPAHALRHYEVGVRIGELSLGDGFEGVLAWGCLDNRPFLRAMHGYGLSLWRLRRHGDAVRVFERMLWMNPGDNQGIRYVLPAVRRGEPWRAVSDR